MFTCQDIRILTSSDVFVFNVDHRMRAMAGVLREWRQPILRDRLQTQISPALGTAQFRMEASDHTQALVQIAQRVDDQLRLANDNVSLSSVLIYGARGLLFLAFAVYQAGSVPARE